MFGIAVARLDQVDDAERARYEELYCGLCRSIKARYGQVSRAALSYDLAFLAMLLVSLNECPETHGAERCVSHPAKAMPFAESQATAFAADMSVMLAYHKCLDDIADDGSLAARAASAFLKGAYDKAECLHPQLCAACTQTMEDIRCIEQSPAAPPDAASIAFGELLGEIFAAEAGAFAETMRGFGCALGRFVYLMDAAVDLRADVRDNSYNPFKELDMTVEGMRTILESLIGEAARLFERLPLERDAHLMRSVIYSGVWQKFNQAYASETTRTIDD